MHLDSHGKWIAGIETVLHVAGHGAVWRILADSIPVIKHLCAVVGVCQA